MSPLTMEEKYKVLAPETMQEAALSDSDEEGGRPLSAAEGGHMFCLSLFLIYLFSFHDFWRANYLNIYWTDLHQICRIARTMTVDERPEVSFSFPQGTLPWQPVLREKSTVNTPSTRSPRTESATAARCCDAGKQIV